jgi:hypothetical protein
MKLYSQTANLKESLQIDKMKKLKLYTRDPQFKSKQPILYFLTTMRDKGTAEDHNRCIGYYISLKIARSIVKGNTGSLCEAGYYRYAIIEAFGSGWYPNAQIEEWYEFSDDGRSVKKIKKPKEYKDTCNFGIG